MYSGPPNNALSPCESQSIGFDFLLDSCSAYCDKTFELPRGPAQSFANSPQFSPVSALLMLKTMSRPKQQHLFRRRNTKAHFPHHTRHLDMIKKDSLG